jgi:hypothetical protein
MRTLIAKARMAYGIFTVIFFGNGREHGMAPGFPELLSAKDFAEGALSTSGADSFAIYFEGCKSPVFVKERKFPKRSSRSVVIVGVRQRAFRVR